MYDEFTHMTNAVPMIMSFKITLVGAHRQLNAQFNYNTVTGTIVSTKADHKFTLNGILRTRFGTDAIAVLVNDTEIVYDEETLLRRSKTGEKVFVLYDDSAPGYADAGRQVLEHDDGTLSALPIYTTVEGSERAAASVITDTGRVRRVQGLTYYVLLPTLTRTINLRFSDGSVQSVLLTNKPEAFDQLLPTLAEAGDRVAGVMVGMKEYSDDDVLFSADLHEGDIYDVTYHRSTSVIGRTIDKRRRIIYTTANE